MKKVILLFITVILLFGVSDAYASTCDGKNCNTCKVVCQYTHEKDYISIFHNTKNNKFEIMYKDFKKPTSRLDMDRGIASETTHSSDLKTFSSLFGESKGSGIALNVDGFGENAICTKNAYRIDNGSNDYFTCLDNDGKSCKEKFGKKIKVTYKYDETEVASTICGDGTNSIADEGVETREENEQEALNALTEHKIVIPDPDVGDGEGCEGLFGPVITEDINTVLKYIKYLGPILIIVLSILDFIKVVASGANDEFNKVWKRLLTRLVVAILLFFVVDLVKLLFHVFGITVPDNCLK